MLDLTKPIDGTTATLLTLLTPGLLAYAIFHSIAKRRDKIEAVNAIIASLGLTLVVQAMWAIAKLPPSIVPTPDVVGLSICSLLAAIGMIALEDYAVFPKFLQCCGLSKHSPWATVWQSAFRQYHAANSYIVLHLKDQRRVTGIVRGWPELQEDGHIVLEHSYWITDELVKSTGILMFPANDISFVEFLQSPNGAAHDRQTTATAATPRTSSEGGLLGTFTTNTAAAPGPGSTTCTTIKITEGEIDLP